MEAAQVSSGNYTIMYYHILKGITCNHYRYNVYTSCHFCRKHALANLSVFAIIFVMIRGGSRKFKKTWGPKNCGESATSLHTNNTLTSNKMCYSRLQKTKKKNPRKKGGRGPLGRPLNLPMIIA